MRPPDSPPSSDGPSPGERPQLRPGRARARAWALAASLPVYGALGAGLTALSRGGGPPPAPIPALAVVLQESETFAPPLPPSGDSGPLPPRAPVPDEMPAQAPRTLPAEPVPPPSSPFPPPQGGGGSPGGPAVGTPGGVPDGLAGGLQGGLGGSHLVPPRFDAAYLQNPSPEYPALSNRLGEEGKVLLRVLVDPEGRAQSLEIKASSGFARLDQAALSTVRRWRFVPARQGPTPVPAWVLVPITFQLDV